MMKLDYPMKTFVLLYIALLSFSNHAQAKDISLIEFQGMLFSEINSAIGVLTQEEYDKNDTESIYSHSKNHNGYNRFLQADQVPFEANELWNQIMKHGWEMSESIHHILSLNNQSGQNRLLEDQSVEVRATPYIICSNSSPNKSGYQRLESVVKSIATDFDEVSFVLNDSHKTCFHVSLNYEAAQSIRESSVVSNSDDFYTIAPMTDLMKIQYQTMNMVSEDSWTVPSSTTPNDWERVIRVGLSAKQQNKANALATAKKIINDIITMSKGGSSNRRRRASSQEVLVNSFSAPDSPSVSEIFSLTAHRLHKKDSSRNLRPRRSNTLAEEPKNNFWERALELGLEADHSCRNMFLALDVNVHHDNQGFDIVLNPSSRFDDIVESSSDILMSKANDGIEGNRWWKANDGIERSGCEFSTECSASNKHCVTSLIIALSTHPATLSIESEGPVESSDYEAQWITQSKIVGRTPLNDIGINGENQVISIIDSGLDINHRYFGPTDTKIFEVSGQNRDLF
jgi:hypothetical protein